MTDTVVNTTANVKKTPKPVRRLTGFNLKMIAVITMFIDHIGGVILEKYLLNSIPLEMMMDTDALPVLMQENKSLAAVAITYFFLRLIGRMAFPIFVFLLVEGFTHTSSIKGYALNLLAFSLISELHFNLSSNNTLFFPGHQKPVYRSSFFRIIHHVIRIFVFFLLSVFI